MSLATPIRRTTIRDLHEATARGEKWAMITAYDALTGAPAPVAASSIAFDNV